MQNHLSEVEQSFDVEVVDEDDEKQQIELLLDRRQEYIDRYYSQEIEIKKINRESEQYSYSMSRLSQDTIHLLNQEGIVVWKDYDSKFFYYRINPYGERKRGNKDKISELISDTTELRIQICDSIDDMIFNDVYYILSAHIQMVEDDIFFPPSSSEFFLLGRILYRNKYKYTPFMRAEYTEPEYPSIIYDFIVLLLGSEFYAGFIFNWLAYGFHDKFNIGIALVLVGDKEVTEDIFLKSILEKILGKKYCITIDDQLLKNKSMNDIIEDKILYNFGDISIDTTNKKTVKKLLRNVLTPSYFDEVYNIENPDNERNTYGLTLVTSDVPYPIIKENYSRCAVYEVRSLSYILSELGLPDEASLYDKIEGDLFNFVNILSNRILDENNIGPILQTKIRGELVLDDEEIISKFILDIKSIDISRFSKIENEDKDLYEELKTFFSKKSIKQKHLYLYFNILYKGRNFTNSYLIEKLKKLDPIFSENSKLRTIPGIGDNDKAYILRD